MKVQLCVISIIMLTLGVGCGKDRIPPPVTWVTLVLDRSDRYLLQTVGEDIPEILQSFQLEQDPWRGCGFRIAQMSSVAYNRSEELQLEAEDPEEGNILVRRNKVKAFLERATELIRMRIAEPRNDSASIVYLPLALELERLAGFNGGTKRIIIYSDLVEHLGKGKWSLYDDRLLDSLRRAPDAFAHYFEKQRALPDLSGITVNVVDIPLNALNSARVSTVYAWYERLLKAKGARVTISGNYHFDG